MVLNPNSSIPVFRSYVAAYRGALIAFSSLHHHSPPLVALYTYWVTVLVGGTIAYLCIATRFLMCLPEWTHFDLVSSLLWRRPIFKKSWWSNFFRSNAFSGSGWVALQEGDIEPPAPYETAMTLSNMVQSGETLFQPFVSPAVLQANETGEACRLYWANVLLLAASCSAVPFTLSSRSSLHLSSNFQVHLY